AERRELGVARGGRPDVDRAAAADLEETDRPAGRQDGLDRVADERLERSGGARDQVAAEVVEGEQPSLTQASRRLGDPSLVESRPLLDGRGRRIGGGPGGGPRESSAQRVARGGAAELTQRHTEVEPRLEGVAFAGGDREVRREPIERYRIAREASEQPRGCRGAEEADPVVGLQQPLQREQHAPLARPHTPAPPPALPR